MMEPIIYFDRLSKKKLEEKVYGQKALQFLYGDDLLSRCFGAPLLHLLSRISFFSAFVGYWQSRPFTKKKIASFIHQYQIEASEFKNQISDFKSFNDFFIRELKKESRPIAKSEATIPADGRYWFYPQISSANFFYVKNKTFNLISLLKDEKLAHRYEHGSMVIARLCPSDYHRFHFPCDGVPHETKLLNGWLYSVNPLALKKDFEILTTNKRTLCCLDTKKFGQVLYLEVGATSVGSIHQTYQPFQPCCKGDEKGYFSFGGSTLILLFEPQTIQFDQDLVQASKEGLEIRCLMGQSMGSSIKSSS